MGYSDGYAVPFLDSKERLLLSSQKVERVGGAAGLVDIVSLA